MSVKHHDEQYRAPWDDDAKAQPEPKKEEGKEESLTTLLDEDQRGELTLLIASATAAMRKTITSSFDANVSVLSITHTGDKANGCRLGCPKISYQSSRPKRTRL